MAKSLKGEDVSLKYNQLDCIYNLLISISVFVKGSELA